MANVTIFGEEPVTVDFFDVDKHEIGLRAKRFSQTLTSEVKG